MNEVLLPLFKISEGNLLEYLGMGFTVTDNLLVTCWHCVDVELNDGESIGAIIMREDGQNHIIMYLENIERDKNGLDLATANHAYVPKTYILELNSDDQPIGIDIWAYGRPHTTKQRLGKEIKFYSPPLLLKGNITRTLSYDHYEYGEMPSYEMSFPPPKGMSGAPIFLNGSTKIIGVIHGSNDISMVEQTRYVDPHTGESEPEIHRIVSYGLAHHTRSLINLQTSATSGLPLYDYVNSKKQ